ncbi:lipocalin family protein [Methylovorus mays]|uniref:lipocalin family protein n=1 Tax=Methylovorus mays TaxID=184077 RepID=UPI002E1A31DA
MLHRLFVIALLSLLTACMGVPPGAEPVTKVDAQRYLGKWYEIARLDHSFERGLEQVSATYSPREDGGIKVINRGYDPEKAKWQEAEGKAYFLKPADADGRYPGMLKVSFFGPFYGAYNILVLDPDYQHVLVSGPDTSYLWVLSRTPQLPQKTLEPLLAKAESLGFATDKLIYPPQPEKP